LEGKVDYKMRKDEWASFPDSWPVLRDFVLFLAGNSFLKVCLTLIVSRRG
jgi:hypothetical protein